MKDCIFAGARRGSNPQARLAKPNPICRLSITETAIHPINNNHAPRHSRKTMATWITSSCQTNSRRLLYRPSRLLLGRIATRQYSGAGFERQIFPLFCVHALYVSGIIITNAITEYNWIRVCRVSFFPSLDLCYMRRQGVHIRHHARGESCSA
jgi:hypothetical protein